MTDRRTPSSDPDATPEGDAMGARIRELLGDVEAPAALRARVESERAHGVREGGAPRRWAVPRLPVLGGAAGALAVVIIALVLVLSGGGGGPSVADAAAVALMRPTAPAPAVSMKDMHLVDARVGGITFPNYAYAWPKWRTSGERSDTLSGRRAVTVTYRGPKGDVGYTIVDGDALPEPSGNVRWITANGVHLAVYTTTDGATVVTWRRAGHTCVLAGRGQGVERQLVAFASWAG
jgi:hypothetical protein